METVSSSHVKNALTWSITPNDILQYIEWQNENGNGEETYNLDLDIDIDWPPKLNMIISYGQTSPNFSLKTIWYGPYDMGHMIWRMIVKVNLSLPM